MRQQRLKRWSWAGAALILAGCAPVGPDYQPVTPATPPAWHAELTAGLVAGDTESLADWWQLLGDPLLTKLEQEAVRDNLDLKAAASRVREARALLGVSRSGLFPSVDGTASASTSRSSIPRKSAGESELYQAGFDADWELDLFGGTRRAVEAAGADIAANQEELRDVLVSLTAEVAINYVDIRTYQARLAAARAHLKVQEQLHQYTNSRYQAGLEDRLAVQRSLTSLEQERARLPALKNQLTAAMNRLAVLLGRPPGSLTQRLSAPAPLPVLPVRLAIGVPAEVLRRRPDVRRAERELAAQTARVGVATADLYPKLRLIGSIGLESLTLENLPEWLSRTHQLGSSLSWKLFDAGAVRRNIEAQTARQEQALIHYQDMVLKALEEVENALTGFVREKERQLALTKATKAAELAFSLARDRYQAGLTDYASVLDSQRELITTRDQWTLATGELTAALIRLYKALGGGWDSTTSG